MKTIFVSSTFRDMHFERDLIHDRIAPAINARAAETGDHVSFCDLRWGINTMDLDQEESSRKVLQVCLDEIDRCRPYMVIIIGARYGWIPDEDLIRYGIRGRNLELEDLERSVTEIEIRYGALSREEDLDHVFIYFRNIAGAAPDVYGPEDEEHLAKLESLKSRLRAVAGRRIKEYTVSWDPVSGSFKPEEEFERLVKKDLLEAFESEWNNSAELSPCERQLHVQFSYAEQKEYPNSSRNDLVRDYLAESRDTAVLALSGVSGCGKTALISRMIHVLKDQGHEVLPVFSGITKECNDARDLLWFICAFLQERLGTDIEISNDIMELREQMIGLVARYNEVADRELYIVIDALDQLFPDEARDSLMFIVPYPGEKIHYIVSFTEDFVFNRPAVRKQIPAPDSGEQVEMIQGILSAYRREVDDGVLAAILGKKTLSSPLYAGLLMQRLQILSREDFEEIQEQGGGMKEISDYQRRIMEEFPDQIDAGAKELIKAAAKQVGGDSVQNILALLAFSRHGLRQEDLFAIMEREKKPYRGLDFSLFVQFLSDFFLIRDDGRYDFTHAKLRDCVRSDGDPKALYERLFRHFQSLDDTDPVKNKEIGFHAIRAGETDYLKQRCIMSTGPAKEALSSDLREQCLLDGGRFLAGLLESEKVGSAFWQYTAEMLREVFGQTRQEADIKRRILIYMYDRMKRYNDAAADDEVYKTAVVYSEIPEILGDCSAILSGREMHVQAKQYYSDAMRALENGLEKTSGAEKEDILRRMIRLLAKAADNDIQIGMHDDAYREAMEGIELSEKYNSREWLLKLYTWAAKSQYFVGSSKKFVERKPLFGRRKGDDELREAAKICARGKKIFEGMYRRGEFSESQILEYAKFLKQYADALAALSIKENKGQAAKLHMESIELCSFINNPWDPRNAKTVFEMYSALVNMYLDDETSMSIEEATWYALKALEIGEYLCEQLRTPDAIRMKIGGINESSLLYLAMKDEPREGQLDEWTQEGVKLSEYLMKHYAGSGATTCYAASLTIRAFYLSLIGDVSGLSYISKARKEFPGVAKTYTKIIMREWKKR